MSKKIILQKYLDKVRNKKRKSFLLAALKMGVKIDVLSGDFRLLRLSWRGKSKILFRSKAHFNKKPSTFFTHNKEITKILLQEAGISVPLGIFSRKFSGALHQMNKKKLSFPVVAKPIDASEGFCVTIGISNKKELASAINKIRRLKVRYPRPLSDLFMVEKLVPGNDYRILVLNKKIIACAQRVPAYIVGDGKTKIKDLIKNFNSKRLSLYQIIVDASLSLDLKQKNLNPNSIILKGQYLQLRKNANICTGGRAIDKTGQVSKRFEKISLKCMEALGLNYGGIDIMTDDISSNDSKQPYYIIEINADPDYEPHEKPIVEGKGVRVSEILVKEFMI